MGCKSRGNWLVSCCLKECANRGVACTRCLRFSQFSDIKSVLAGKTDLMDVLAVENGEENNVIKSTKR